MRLSGKSGPLKPFFPPTVKEFHSFGIGLMDGVSHQPYQTRLKKAIDLFDDVKAEPHYYRAGYFLTNRSKWVLGTVSAVKLGCGI